MPTYLMKWNPNKSQWKNFELYVNNIRADQHFKQRWSCGNNKSIHADDRIFLIRLGVFPKGISASGWAVSEVDTGKSWNQTHAQKGKSALYVNIEWDVLLNPDTEEILSRDELKKGVLAEMHWDGPPSGIRIPENVSRELERRWSRFLCERPNSVGIIAEEELTNPSIFIEGGLKQVSLNIYERNPKARRECLLYYGYDCCVCDFNFERTFGKIASNFIHVHHLKPLSEIGKRYKLNPTKDLRPLCPNCHSIAHRRKPAYTIDELRALREGQ